MNGEDGINDMWRGKERIIIREKREREKEEIRKYIQKNIKGKERHREEKRRNKEE